MGEKTSPPDNFVSRSDDLIRREDRIFSVQEGGHWMNCFSFLEYCTPHCIIIAIVVEALAAGLASMTILAHEIIKQNFQHCCSSPNVYGDLYGHMFFDFRVKL